MKPVRKSAKLANVCYDIRGPVLQKVKQMEEEGHKIIKLNIGNLAAFGFDSPEEIQQDIIRNLPSAAGYTDSKGIFSARKAIMHYCQQKRIKGVTLEDIYVGNGVSELIAMAMNALLNDGDEVLVPATASELVSNQVGNWLSKLSSDVDLGVNYRPGSNVSQDEVALALSTALLNERLLLSTNVGVLYGNTSAAQTNALIGDFQVEYLLTADGKLRLKAFSVSNDRNLNQVDQAPTTQGAGVAYREEFNSLPEFWQKLRNFFRRSDKDVMFD